MRTHYFNPGYEASIERNITQYTPPKMVQRLRIDLQTLPLYYANHEDNVFISSPLPSSFTHPKMFFSKDAISDLSPWGWAPELLGIFRSINAPYPTEDMKYLASRKRSIDFWKLIEQEIVFPSFFQEPIAISECPILQDDNWVIKEEFSSSGRGITTIFATQNINKIIKARRERDKWQSIEPYYPITKEMGYEFVRTTNGEIKYLGKHIAIVCNNTYVGSKIGAIDEDILETTYPSEKDYISALTKALFSLPLKNYAGIIGIDTGIIHIANASYIIPSLEINIRPTMGYVALQLQKKYLSKGQKGQFIITRKQDCILKQVKCGEPLYLMGKVESLAPGLYPLTPILKDTQFVACLSISNVF